MGLKGRDMKNTKILTVDDQPDDLDIINHILKKYDYNIISARNGLEALDTLGSNPDIDIIVLDRMMPVMDGISFPHRIKQNNKFNSIPVIIQTAADDDHQVAEGIESGVYWYITKPYSNNLLSSIVRSALRFCKKNKRLTEITDFYIDKRKKVKKGMARMDECSFSFSKLEDAEYVANAIACAFPEPRRIIGPCIEMLVNAVEHGNLGIDFEEKSKLILDGKWHEEIEYRQTLKKNLNKKVSVNIRTEGDSMYLTVKDEGKGFDWNEYLHLDKSRSHMVNGRGIYLAGLEFDEVEYLGSGNEVVCRKILDS